MIKPACGSIWMPITSTTKSLRPVKPYRASAIAARNASATEIATVTSTTIRLFFTSSQKNGLSIASRKCDSVGCSGNHVGIRLTIWSFDLNAVEIIQKTGKTITTKTARPTAFQPPWRTRRRLSRALTATPPRCAPSCAHRRR